MGDLPFDRKPKVDVRALQRVPLRQLELVVQRLGLENQRIQKRFQLPENRSEEKRATMVSQLQWIQEIQEQIGSELDRRSEILLDAIVVIEGDKDDN